MNKELEIKSLLVALETLNINRLIKLESMKAENQLRDFKGEKPAYTEKHFEKTFKESDEVVSAILRKIDKLMNE